MNVCARCSFVRWLLFFSTLWICVCVLHFTLGPLQLPSFPTNFCFLFSWLPLFPFVFLSLSTRFFLCVFRLLWFFFGGGVFYSHLSFFMYDYSFRQMQVVCTIFWINFEWDLVGSQVSERWYTTINIFTSFS